MCDPLGRSLWKGRRRAQALPLRQPSVASSVTEWSPGKMAQSRWAGNGVSGLAKHAESVAET